MRHLSFKRNLIRAFAAIDRFATMLLPYIKGLAIFVSVGVAFILLIAEGETWIQTILIKAIACALMGVIYLIVNIDKDGSNGDYVSR